MSDCLCAKIRAPDEHEFLSRWVHRHARKTNGGMMRTNDSDERRRQEEGELAHEAASLPRSHASHHHWRASRCCEERICQMRRQNAWSNCKGLRRMSIDMRSCSTTTWQIRSATYPYHRRKNMFRLEWTLRSRMCLV